MIPTEYKQWATAEVATSEQLLAAGAYVQAHDRAVLVASKIRGLGDWEDDGGGIIQPLWVSSDVLLWRLDAVIRGSAAATDVGAVATPAAPASSGASQVIDPETVEAVGAGAQGVKDAAREGVQAVQATNTGLQDTLLLGVIFLLLWKVF